MQPIQGLSPKCTKNLPKLVEESQQSQHPRSRCMKNRMADWQQGLSAKLTKDDVQEIFRCLWRTHLLGHVVFFVGTWRDVLVSSVLGTPSGVSCWRPVLKIQSFAQANWESLRTVLCKFLWLLEIFYHTFFRVNDSQASDFYPIFTWRLVAN